MPAWLASILFLNRMNVTNDHKLAEKRKALTQHKNLIPVYLTGFIIAVAIFLLAHFRVFPLSEQLLKLIGKVAIVLALSFLVWILLSLGESLVHKQSKEVSKSYNLIRVLRLGGVVATAVIFISFLNQNWYAAAVSLGLISLVLGFALQSPIASFIGWFYIIIRTPYKVGDRVQTGDLKGDVVEIGYMDTTLWEFGGEYMSGDIATGRLIRFPNSLVWQQAVYNYSWHRFPYIWNEIPFHVAYESKLSQVEKVMRDTYEKLYGKQMAAEVRRLSEDLAATPVEEPDETDYPMINFKIHDNTWVEVLITYLVEPKQSAGTRSQLIKEILEAFHRFPGEIMFPKSDSR